jgi:hypothetical protein
MKVARATALLLLLPATVAVALAVEDICRSFYRHYQAYEHLLEGGKSGLGSPFSTRIYGSANPSMDALMIDVHNLKR